MKKIFIIILMFLVISPNFLFSNENSKKSDKFIKPKIIKTKVVTKKKKYERKSPLLAYLDRIERRLSENKKYPLTKSRKCKIVKQIREKLSKNQKRKQYLLGRINRIKKDISEIDLFQKISKDILKRLDTIKTIDNSCKKINRK